MDSMRCETCVYRTYDSRGYYCGNPKSVDYGLFSVYGWCELHVDDEHAIKEAQISMYNFRR